MTSRIRVALGTIYPVDETQVHGGVEAVALYLANSMAKRDDIELHVVSCNRVVNSSFTERHGQMVFHWIAAGHRFYNLRAGTIDAWQVRRVYEQIRPDIIHAQGCSEYAMGAPGITPLVLTIHGLEIFNPAMLKTDALRGLAGLYRKWVGGWIFRQSVTKAGAIISIAGDYVPRVISTLLNNKHVYNIANPILPDEWYGVPEDRISGNKILCVGEIIERKNALGLLQAFSKVISHLPEVELCFAGGFGEPAYHALLRKEISTLGLEKKVSFLGHLDQSKLTAEYADSSIVVLASIQETAPMAIAQAMASGKPVVATRVGGIPWMVEDGVTGYLVDVGDAQSLANRIVELLQNNSLRQRMGQAAREAAWERFAADKVVEQTVQVYRELLGNRSA